MIRLATPKDLRFIQKLAEQVFSQFGDYRRILREFFYARGVTTFIWDLEGRPAGLGMVELLWDPETRSYYTDLLAIAVDPACQSQGVGGQLIQALFNWSWQHGADTIRLSVADTNHQAQRFFRRHGFILLRANDGRYPAGQRAHLMGRSLVKGDGAED